MRGVLRAALLAATCLAAPCLASGSAHAQSLTTMGVGGAPVSSGGGCSQATTVLAYSGFSGLTTPQKAAYTALICGEVADGDYAHLYAQYLPAVSLAVAEINVVNPGTYNLTQSATPPTFSSPGVTGNGSNAYFNTGFNPSTAVGGGWQNSATLGACVVNARTTAHDYFAIAATDHNALFNAFIDPYQGGGTYPFLAELDGQTYATAATTSSQGAWAIQRSSSSGVTFYKNGVSISAPGSSTDGSAGNMDEPLYILARNQSGSGIDGYSPDTLGPVFIGDGAVNIANVYARLHTFWTSSAIGGSGC